LSPAAGACVRRHERSAKRTARDHGAVTLSDGCPWDRQQTFASIAPYTIEEAYEVADASSAGLRQLKDELGRSIVQVGSMRRWQASPDSLILKPSRLRFATSLRRRHLMYSRWGALEYLEQTSAWEDIKADERGAADVSALHGVPNALPRCCAPTS